MNQVTNSTPIIQELNICHKVINERIFNNELKETMITFFTDGKDRKTLGHYTTQKVWNDNHREMVIKGLAWNGDSDRILETITHEMVHQYCLEHDIHDVETNGRHNKKFKEMAEKFGLIVLKPTNKNYGYNTGGLKPEVLEKLKNSEINIELLANFRNTFVPVEKDKKEKKSYKYICENCDIKFTITKQVNITCNDCETPFTQLEK